MTEENEGVVYKYLVNLGYNVGLGRWEGTAGTPDFLVNRPEGKCWVEVKSIYDGLRTNQIEWISKSKDPCFIAICKSNIITFFRVNMEQVNKI